MKKAMQDLLELQGIDMRIRNLKIKYSTIPKERAQITAEFEVVRKELIEAKQEQMKLQQAVKFLEQNLKEQQAKLQQLQVRSGQVKKQSEYTASMEAIERQKQVISDLESEGLELLDKADKANAAVEKTERKFRATGRVAQAEVRELDALKAKIEAEIAEKSAISKTQEKKIAVNTLLEYKRFLAAGKGAPVGKIVNGLCENCNLRLPPMTLNEAKKGNLIHCDNCTFFLYDPDAKTDED